MIGRVGSESGPVVARAFHRLLGLVFVAAWISLGSQVQLLIGSDGLAPVAELLERSGAGPPRVPTWMWLSASDAAIATGVWVGATLSFLAALGWQPRFCTGVATLLYLGYAAVGREFLSFQWDNLLLECGFLAVFLPTDRRAGWIHVLFRLLIVKLYWESGIAKWQSHLGDWQDGSAMQLYYQTAPLPTWAAWYAHHLPGWWHHLESWTVLALELVLPFAVFGARRARLTALLILSGFQVINLATANYGFFCYLALALHIFLLDDGDLRRGASASVEPLPSPPRRALRAVAALLVSGAFISVSTLDGLRAFATLPPSLAALPPWYETLRSWRVINTYHLFGHITRQRVEAEFQSESQGVWTAYDLRNKPGRVDRAPPFTAPHQPRVDFQLWFYGLSFQRGTPPYVAEIGRRLCTAPSSVQQLFDTPLPAHPDAVRIVFWDYRFTEPGDGSGDWWSRQQVASTHAIACADLVASAPSPPSNREGRPP